MKIENTEVYGLFNTSRVARFPMAVDTSKISEGGFDRLRKLSEAPIGSGHANALNGIIVQFDITASNKFWVEAERYHWFEIVSSQSTMHRLKDFDIRKMCNEYVSESIIDILENMQAEYNKTKDKEDLLTLLYNAPAGIELTVGMSTNYLQLKTIYNQRRHHLLPEWQMVCDWIESLPYSYLITGGITDENE